jgi:outer membrane protein assembly factor BamB
VIQWSSTVARMAVRWVRTHRPPPFAPDEHIRRALPALKGCRLSLLVFDVKLENPLRFPFRPPSIKMSTVRVASRRIVAVQKMTGKAILAVTMLIVGVPLHHAGAQDWSRFRGPNGTGVAETTGLPLEIGPKKNLIWKTPLPPGHSSPILSEDRVFLTAFEGKKLLTIGLDRESGKILWQRESPRDRETKLDSRNNPASPSPAVDEQNVYVFFADYGIVSYDFEGKERWRHPLGPFNNTYGMGASPILADDKVLLVCDHNRGSYIIALSKEDGSVMWKTDRPEAKSGHSTPVLYHPEDGSTQVIVPGSFLLTAYSVDSGEKIWWVSGLSFEMKSTPVLDKGTIYIHGYGSPLNQPGNQIEVPTFDEALSELDGNGDDRFSKEEAEERTKGWFTFVDLNGDGFLESEEWSFYRAAMASTNGLLAIRVGGRGDMTESSVLWRYHRSVPQLPSPLLYRGVLYMVNDGGIVTSFKPESGEVIAQGRLEGAVDKYFASPVAADGKIYMASEQGKIAVLEPGGNLKPVAVSDLDDSCYATPAISRGRIYLRTPNALYCFGKEK